jgi:putative endonuclease
MTTFSKTDHLIGHTLLISNAAAKVTKTNTAYQVGGWVESLAHNYLTKQGLKRLNQNYRCRIGEIDLIMQDDRYLVFIEVRYRKNDDFGGAKASVTRQKQKKIRRVAEYYLKRFGPRAQHIFCRFDVMAVCAVREGLKIEWLKNAF